MTVPIIYRSDDGNAPVLNGMRTLPALLYACLVTGYGDKLGAGWTRPFVDANGTRACFRPGSGTRFYLAVDQTTPADGRTTGLAAFEAMTSEADGTLPFGAVTSVNVSSQATATARSWVLVATDSWMLFVSHYSQATTIPPTKAQLVTSASSWMGLSMFFGDIEKINPSDGFNCMFLWGATGGPSGLGNANAASVASASYHYLARKLSGVAGGVVVSCQTAPPASGNNYFGTVGPAYTGISGLLCSKISVNDGEAYTLRGWLPRMLNPCHPRPFENLETVVIGGVPYLCVMWSLYNAATYVCQILIDMSED